LLQPLFPQKVPFKFDVYMEDCVFKEPQLIGSSGDVQGVIREDSCTVRPPQPRVWRNEGVLAHISANRLDLEAVRALDPHDAHLQGLLDVITSEKDFLKYLNGPLKSGRLSRHMRQHLHAIIGMNVASLVDGSETLVEMPLFTIEKKDGSLRLILDCRNLNKVMAVPPPMKLPPLHDFIDTVLQAGVASQADGVSYFYEIPLAPPLQKYFGSRVAGARGHIFNVVMNSLPMGWSWAPAVAQAISNALVKGCGLAWVDRGLLRTVRGGRPFRRGLRDWSLC
jgi:hypothetical protein